MINKQLGSLVSPYLSCPDKAGPCTMIGNSSGLQTYIKHEGQGCTFQCNKDTKMSQECHFIKTITRCILNSKSAQISLFWSGMGIGIIVV